MMNLWRGNCFKLFLCIFVLVFVVIAVPAPAQVGQTQTEKPSEKTNKAKPVIVQLNADAVRIKQLTPIRFKAFALEEFRDPKTSLPIAAESEIKLKSGKTIKGKDFIAEINKLEMKFNELGYTLRNRQAIKIQESVFDRNLLETQRRSIKADRSKYASKPTSKPFKGSDLQTFHAESLKLALSRIKAIEQYEAQHKPKFIPFYKTGSYDNTWGPKDLFAAGHHANVVLDGKEKDRVIVHAEGGATGYLFGRSRDIINIRGYAEARKQNMQATFTASVLGDDFINVHKIGKDSLIIKDEKIPPENSYSVSFPFTIGPIPISVTFGLRVNAKASYEASLTPLEATVKVTPEVSAEVYGECAVDLEVASAGIGGSLTLLKDKQELYASLSQETEDQLQPYFSGEYYGKDHMSTLDGNVYLFAEVDLWLWSDSWTWDIFSWDGIKDDGFIIPSEKFTEALYTGVKERKLKMTIDRLSTSYKTGYLTGVAKFGEHGYQSAPLSVNIHQSNYAPHWVLENNVFASDSDKLGISIMICHYDEKPPFAKKNIRKCGEPIKVDYDFATRTFSGMAKGKAGETITYKGADGEIQFRIEVLPVFGAPRVAK